MLVRFVLVLLCATNLLLWRFLDFAPPWLYLVGAIASAAAIYWGTKPQGGGAFTTRQVAACAALALAIMLLGGEGRFFYANFDWQIRDAVLRDMVLNPWPFAYGGDQLLRAPIGMYLLPALGGKALGLRAAELVLLLQNTGLLTAILLLGSRLFPTRRTIALIVVIAFSGMDALGVAVIALGSRTGAYIQPDLHLEWWGGMQFSSHLTQAFWVPQHAFTGWLGAVLFLLWKNGQLPARTLFAAVPLLALWSPLAAIGILPFAAYAGFKTLRDMTPIEVAVPALAATLAVPALLYLSASGDAVGFRLFPISVKLYTLVEFSEVLPYLGAIAVIGWRKCWGAILLIAGACLVLMPFGQIGESVDFMMRASIPALAILSFFVADSLITPGKKPLAKIGLIAILTIGAITPMLELARAVAMRPTPQTNCNLVEAWHRVEGLPVSSAATYLAPIEALPKLIRPATPKRAVNGHEPCWARPWQVIR